MRLRMFAGVFVLLLITGAMPLGAQTPDETSPVFDNQNPVASASRLGVGSSNATLAAAIEPLTTEEQELLRLGLLPANFAQLKAAYKTGGLAASRALMARGRPDKGLYSEFFGNPPRLLEWARVNRGNPAMLEFLKNIHRGDIILKGTTNTKSDVISIVTDGAYHHAMLCVENGPPPEFIDAVGHGVQRACAADLWSGSIMRIVRPTAGLDPAAAKLATDRAVAYAERQLGKPYDTAFTDVDGDRSFYCSELALKAYSVGAGMPVGQLRSKDPLADRTVLLANNLAQQLGYKGDLNVFMQSLGMKINAAPIEKRFELIEKALFEDVLPNCRATEDIIPTAAGRAEAMRILQEIRTGKAFPQYDQAVREFDAAKARGDFNPATPPAWANVVTLGLAKTGCGAFAKAKETAMNAKKIMAATQDLNTLCDRPGLSKTAALKFIFTLALPAIGNLGTIASTLNRSSVALPGPLQKLSRFVETLQQDRDRLDSAMGKWWPVFGPVGWWIHGSADQKAVLSTFTSPSDLGRTPAWSADYQPGSSGKSAQFRVN